MIEAAKEVYLCVESNEDQDGVTRLVADADKLRFQPASRDGRPQRGVPLRRVNTPRGLPAQQNLHYFRVVREGSPDVLKLWGLVVEEERVAVYWGLKENVKLDQLSLFLIMSA